MNEPREVPAPGAIVLHPDQVKHLPEDPVLGPVWEPTEPSPEVLDQIRELTRKAMGEAPHTREMPGPECSELVKVHGIHQGHHVHNPRPNRYECLECKVMFRFKKKKTLKRSRLLR